ncbi:Fanconi anemia core complex-associated protein 20 isoform X2 [Tenrec ecaudatus]|uniref:Fanconi anemia core complex-associated protein 20 isoform X2 n=1 Tax=Tenrec ecaudatus TaxID=94439 RepID=UPI003F596757
MAAEAGGGRRSRLRLSRRRPPCEAGPPRGRPWFLQPAGSLGLAEPWAELLRAACPDGDLAAATPPLPAFRPQEPRGDPQPAAPAETFTAGGEVFAWTPFPPPLRCWARPYSLHCRAGVRARTPAQLPSQGLEPEPEPETLSAKEPQLVEKSPSKEAAPALQCCPMCQAEFGTTPS